jgi:hypothetical protein
MGGCGLTDGVVIYCGAIMGVKNCCVGVAKLNGLCAEPNGEVAFNVGIEHNEESDEVFNRFGEVAIPGTEPILPSDLNGNIVIPLSMVTQGGSKGLKGA